jgi:hypothetical protein
MVMMPQGSNPRTGLTIYELDRLGTYNAEKARGIVHSDKWKADMAELQRRFNDAQQGQDRPGSGHPAHRRRVPAIRVPKMFQQGSLPSWGGHRGNPGLAHRS